MSAAPDALAEGATAFACPYCGSPVPVSADAPRRATVRRVELPEASIPTVSPTAQTPVSVASARPRASSGPAWRVGAVFVVALVAALGFTGHVIRRILAPEPVVEPLAVVPRPPPAAPPTPTNLTRPPPRPRLVAPIAVDSPNAVVTDWREMWTAFEPAGLKLRVSLPGERRRRVVKLPGGVEGVEESGAEGPAQYRVLALPSPDGSLTAAALPKLLASLRPDPLTVPAFEVVGAQECVGWRCRGYDGTEWTLLAFVRAGKLVLLVRSLDSDALAKWPGFDAVAGWRRFTESVELLRAD